MYIYSFTIVLSLRSLIFFFRPAAKQYNSYDYNYDYFSIAVALEEAVTDQMEVAVTDQMVVAVTDQMEVAAAIDQI